MALRKKITETISKTGAKAAVGFLTKTNDFIQPPKDVAPTPSPSVTTEVKNPYDKAPPKDEPIASVNTNYDGKGNVKYSTGGKDFILTKDEYKFLATGLGKETQNARNAKFAEDTERAIRENIKKGKDAAYQDYIAGEASKRVLGALPEAQQKDITQTQRPSDISNLTLENGQVVTNVGALPGENTSYENKKFNPLQAVQNTLQVYDNFKSFLSGSDTKKVTEARRLMTQTKTALNQQIQDISLGTGSVEDARLSLLIMTQNINELEKQTKKENATNFRYFLRDGSPLMQEILLYKSELEQFKVDLDTAAQQQKLKMALARTQ